MAASSNISTPSASDCSASTQTSQAEVMNIGKASSCLKVCSQAPGRGSIASRRSLLASTRYGSAMPTPMVANTASTSSGELLSVKPTAPPMKGAVQGVATTTAITPVMKLPQ